MSKHYSDPLNITSELQCADFDLFLSLAVIAGVVTLYMIYLMLRPLLEDGEISADEWTRLEDDSLALLRQRDRVIEELKEIEFEAAMNKLDAHDLSQLRGQYQREALRLIEELESQREDYSEQLSMTNKSIKKQSDSLKNAEDGGDPHPKKSEMSRPDQPDHESSSLQTSGDRSEPQPLEPLHDD